MREIKFRAWLNNLSRMIDVLHLDLENWEVQELILKNPGHEWIWHQDFELIQSTSLLDKHGKEIYEGDIVIFENKNYRVIWNKHEASFDFSVDSIHDAYNGGIAYRVKIIGNSYENPELNPIKPDK